MPRSTFGSVAVSAQPANFDRGGPNIESADSGVLDEAVLYLSILELVDFAGGLANLERRDAGMYSPVPGMTADDERVDAFQTEHPSMFKKLVKSA